MSAFARTSGKALSAKNLENPPTLPTRADPWSEEARVFGPFSKRRRVNIIWKYFTNNWRRLYPPLELSMVPEPSASPSSAPPKSAVRDVGLQGLGLLEEVRRLAGPIRNSPPMPRRQRRELKAMVPESSETHSREHSTFYLSETSTRFMRRRYRELLGRLPILTYKPNLSGSRSGGYSVSLDQAAIHPQIRTPPSTLPDTDAVDLAWIKRDIDANMQGNKKQ
jgi:hypothetical protein